MNIRDGLELIIVSSFGYEWRSPIYPPFVIVEAFRRRWWRERKESSSLLSFRAFSSTAFLFSSVRTRKLRPPLAREVIRMESSPAFACLFRFFNSALFLARLRAAAWNMRRNMTVRKGSDRPRSRGEGTAGSYCACHRSLLGSSCLIEPRPYWNIHLTSHYAPICST